LFYQGVLIAGFCFAADAWLLRYRSATQISVCSFVTPLFGLVFARLLRLDLPSSWLIGAGIGMTLGIYLGHPNKIKTVTTG